MTRFKTIKLILILITSQGKLFFLFELLYVYYKITSAHKQPANIHPKRLLTILKTAKHFIGKSFAGMLLITLKVINN